MKATLEADLRPVETSPLTNEELRQLMRERSPGEIVMLAERVKHTGGCEHPIRLRATGLGSPSVGEPDGVLLIACKSRRETRCEPCAATYRADARQIVRAGLEGGKGMPLTVASHPAVFVTVTAPSFGPVHRAGGAPCHARGPGRCSHGRPKSCLSRHTESDELVGAPLCAQCYDYLGAVLFNATAGELWRRVTIYARRHLAYLLKRPERELKDEVRLSYLKVAELQRRGVVHLHGIVRADAARDEVLPPPAEITTLLLSRAILRAVAAVYKEVEIEGVTRRLVFGEQVRVDPLSAGEARGVASYLAKYLTKEASGTGALDHRLREGELEYLELPEHLRRVVETAWSLGEERGQDRLRRFAHALGYTGHVMTKSRRYSTTFRQLRLARLAWRLAATDEPSIGRELQWSYVGSGFSRPIDAILASTVAEDRRRARGERWASLREEKAA